nr:PREDICTED: uncharacterized protein LOC109037829 [Bemisia tabaci]
MDDSVGALNADTVLQLRQLGIPWAQLARECNISRNSLYKRRKQLGLEEPNSHIDNVHLEYLLRGLCEAHPSWGSVSLRGALLSMGYHVAENRIRAILRQVDPDGVAARRRRALKRRVFSVPGANYLWCIDGHHKLIMYHFVVHGCVDGFSRKTIFCEVSCNNRASTVVEAFQEGVQRSGLPHRVRGDYGGENEEVARLICDLYEDNGRFIFGPSTHNQRIERLWRDTREKVIDLFKEIFMHLESNGVLDTDNMLDIFCLHYCYLSRIQRDLDLFVETWNNHSLRTLHGKTPNQTWLLNMLHQGYGLIEDNLAVSSIAEQRSMDTMINRIITSSFYSELPLEVINLWIGQSVETLPDPLQEDGQFGINNYLQLRNHLLSID